ncbi:MAG TPA: hypothetical protein VFH10_08050 [Nocardioides sp.]|uniref:glycosyltransferase n=1 Tax=Nocardioides sp. TaxID=35761 RepID=UPI002D80E293|nr:hypothetical protein [Nocardioides sp.]HET6652578.1 hypothetical protein [Nocardioides sp.]
MTPTDDPRDDDRFGLHVRDLASLRREARVLDHGVLASVVRVDIDACGTSPSLLSNPAWPRLVRLSIEPRGDGVSLEAHFDAPAPVGDVVAAVARSVVPGRLEPAGWPATATGPASRTWAPDADFPPDLVVTDEPLSLQDVPDPHPVLTRPPVVVVTGPDPTWTDSEDRGTDSGPIDLGPLDERLLNPVGFKRQHRQPVAHLVAHEDPDRLELRTAKGKVLLDTRHGPSEQDIDGLRRLAAVHLSWEGTRGPRAYARVVAGLAMAGVPLVGDPVPDWANALLHPALTEVLTRVPTGSVDGGVSTTLDLDDIVEREAHSIRLRRAALTHHSAAGWRRAAGLAHGLQTMPAPKVSVLLPTRRPEQVAFALRQVARQRGVDLELVLVTHGFEAGDADLEAFKATGVHLTVLEAGVDRPFGAILNLAARAASGDVFLKMDDDDWYGRDFASDLLLARAYSGADVVGTPPEFTYVEPLGTTVRRQDATEAFRPIVAGGTMLVDRGTFTAVGGFRETRKFVDAGLLAAVREAGGTVYRSHGHGYVLRRGAQGHTWDPGLGYFVSRKLSWHQWRGFRPSPLLEPDEVDLPPHPIGEAPA